MNAISNDAALVALHMVGLTLFGGLTGYLIGAIGGALLDDYLPVDYEHRSRGLRISRTTSRIEFEVGWIDSRATLRLTARCEPTTVHTPLCTHRCGRELSRPR